MGEHISSKIVKIRKDRECFTCCRSFLKGSKMLASTNTSEGSIYTLYVCTTCKDLYSEFPARFEGSEWLMESEGIRDCLLASQTPEELLSELRKQRDGAIVEEVGKAEKYYIVCMAHTLKGDKYITLWGPDNAGYHFSREMSGLYNEPQKGYHDSEINLPITQALAESLFTCVTYEGKQKHMILNNAHSWNRLGLAWHKGQLIRIAKPEKVEEKGVLGIW